MPVNRSFIRSASIFVLTLVLSFAAYSQAKHPLDPLSAEEIDKAVSILRTSPTFPKAAMFSTVQLSEPSKEIVNGFKPGQSIKRTAFAIVFDREKNKTFEATVDL